MAEQFGVFKKGRSWAWKHGCGNGKTKTAGNFKDQESANITYRLHTLGCEADK
jgi:hypothetical protein